MEQQAQQQIPQFTLYGLIGCPHCQSAETFLRVRNIPALLIIANDDPIVQAGIKEITKQDQYPVLIHKPSREVLVGYKPEDYERLAKNYFNSISSNVGSLFGSNQQPVPQAPVENKTPAAS